MTTMLSLILAFMLSIGGSPAASISPGVTVSPVNAGNSSSLNLNINEKPRLGEISKIRLFEPMLIAQKARIIGLFRIDFEKSLLVGYYYYRHRYYMPRIGRFLQTDPTGYTDSMNLYQAFNQNPVNFRDPFGRSHVGPSIVPCYLAAKEGNPAIARVYERISIAGMMAIGGGVVAKIVGLKAFISAMLAWNITSTLDETVERRKAGQTPGQVNRAAVARLLMFGPFYKIITGRDFGIQQRVSLEDRVATAGEIFVGTLGFVTGYKAVSSSGSSPSTMQLIEDTFRRYKITPMKGFHGVETGIVWGTKVKYLSEAERQAYRLTIKDGKLYDSAGKLFDTTNASTIVSGEGKAIFVMDEFGNIYASQTHAIGEFHHSSFLAGKKVAAAGEIAVKNGVITTITRGSGHYRPTIFFRKQFLFELFRKGVDMVNTIIKDGF